jgi:hypothetical protein
MGKRKTVIVLAGLVAVSLTVLLLDKPKRSSSNRVPRAEGNTPPAENTAELLEPPAEEQHSQNLRTEVIAPTVHEAADLLQLQKDRAFIDACARPKETETDVLKELATRASTILGAQVSEEVASRVEAGLYEQVPGYRPAEKLSIPLRHGDDIQSVFFTETGEALSVDLPRAEYPDLYALRDSIEQLKSELKFRGESISSDLTRR